MEKYSKLEYGFKLANPSAIGSMVKLRDKDYVGVHPSLDTITLTTSGNFTAFVFDGVTTTLASAIAISASTVNDIRDAIAAIIQAKEGAVYVNVTYAGGDLTVEHIGHLRLTSIACSDVGGGAQQATTNNTTVVTVSRFSWTDVVGTIGPLRYKSADEALGSDPYTWSGTSGTDDATAADLAADIATELGDHGLTVYGSAVGTRNDATSSFDGYVEVQNVEQGLLLVGADQVLVQSNIRIEFV